METDDNQPELKGCKFRRKSGVIAVFDCGVWLVVTAWRDRLESITNKAIGETFPECFGLHQKCVQKEKRRCHLTQKYMMSV